jgi:hypothetical protein
MRVVRGGLRCVGVILVGQAGFQRVGVEDRDRSERDQEGGFFYLIYPAGDHFVSFISFYFSPFFLLLAFVCDS